MYQHQLLQHDAHYAGHNIFGISLILETDRNMQFVFFLHNVQPYYNTFKLGSPRSVLRYWKILWELDVSCVIKVTVELDVD